MLALYYDRFFKEGLPEMDLGVVETPGQAAAQGAARAAGLVGEAAPEADGLQDEALLRPSLDDINV